MLEITGYDISQLNDTDLRTLIGYLCELELSSQKIPTTGVTYGGDQKSKDGGIDVRVETASIVNENSYIPKCITGYQVKATKMGSSSIAKEMRPSGSLREIIADLANKHGAYIIISGKDSTSDSSLNARKIAMKQALSDCQNKQFLKVDFYDSVRIATWVRNFPSLIVWVKEKVGLPMQGWKPYGNWSNSKAANEEEYVLDDRVRLVNMTYGQRNNMTALDGINTIREILHVSKSSVRLTGLSGVGKTRLLQALFDNRVGKNNLDSKKVIYTDISLEPEPSPCRFAQQLLSLKQPLLLVVDNCPPELHRNLTDIAIMPESLISLITIEYDVREDQPEETDVFRLEPSSDELIEKLIMRRFDFISQSEANIIAKFSGGNARIALALAGTVNKNESLSHLSDEVLFKRLFLQRNDPNEKLLEAAEICSLVYSFSIEMDESSNQEMKTLSTLVGVPILTLYGYVNELKSRELVQQRGIWRAVLPHALANRLALSALKKFPPKMLLTTFEACGLDRLLVSFSRRLGYLHDSEEAIAIVKFWLNDKNSRLYDVEDLSAVNKTLFFNISSTVPEFALQAIERIANKPSSDFFSCNMYKNEFEDLLQSIAYESNLFERAANLLVYYIINEKDNILNSSSMRSLKSLFYLRLSGTHASPEQRLSFIQNLVKSNEYEKETIAIELLDATLEAMNFTSYHEFDFGAHHRDYGYLPETWDEERSWYKIFIEYSTELIINSHHSKEVKAILGKSIRGLLIRSMCTELENASKEIISNTSWNEGWIGVKTSIKYDEENMSKEELLHVNTLANILQPTTLIEQARLYACASRRNAQDLELTLDDNEDYNIIEMKTRKIGCMIGAEPELYKQLIPDLLVDNGLRIYFFGQGLADGCTDHQGMWDYFQKCLISIDQKTRNYQIVRGFLNSLSELDTNLCEKILDQIAKDNMFLDVYPGLQMSVKINSKGFERLIISLENNQIPICAYQTLAYGGVLASLDDLRFVKLIRLIVSKQGGIFIALEIYYMRILRQPKLEHIIKLLGQDLILLVDFSEKASNWSHIEYSISKIVKACFTDDADPQKILLLCEKIYICILEHKITYNGFPHIMLTICSFWPRVFLDVFLGEDKKQNYYVDYFISGKRGMYSNLLVHITDEQIIMWCEKKKEVRYLRIANLIEPFYYKDNIANWTSLALHILTVIQDPIEVLDIYEKNLWPISWSNSLADIMQRRKSLVTNLKLNDNPKIAEWASEKEVNFQKRIDDCRNEERLYDCKMNERFE